MKTSKCVDNTNPIYRCSLKRCELLQKVFIEKNMFHYIQNKFDEEDLYVPLKQ